MKLKSQTRIFLAAGAILAAISLGGCSHTEAPQVPTGMKMGAPLTQAQTDAIVQKRMAGWQKQGN
jgi:hypothetical protein